LSSYRAAKPLEYPLGCISLPMSLLAYYVFWKGSLSIVKWRSETSINESIQTTDSGIEDTVSWL
jgi:hypothetical protein